MEESKNLKQNLDMKDFVRCGGKMKAIRPEVFKCEKCGNVVSTCGWLFECDKKVEEKN